ncbi:hypothetical protein HWV62_38140 [Athelia sp. TMB]|nr:hypothetical protein HWV62_38140 [Athelia sp. TMB]
MPKATTANSYPHFVTVAKDDVSGITTTTTLNINKSCFAKLSVNRKQKKSTKSMVPLRTRLNPERSTDNAIELEKHFDKQWALRAFMDDYFKHIRSERSITPPPSGPLIDRIGHPIYEPSKPITPGITFKKSKILERIKEFQIPVLATGERLTYFQNKVDSLGLNKKYLENVDKLIKNFNKLDLEFIAHRLTNKQWCLLRRDMNMKKFKANLPQHRNMSMTDIRELEMAIPASNDAWNEGLMEEATIAQRNIFSEDQFHTLARMMANAFGMTRGFTTHYVQQVAENIVNELDNCVGQSNFDLVEATTGANTTTLGAEFNGADGKVKFQEWMNKIQLWVVHEDIVTDRHHISTAMNKLAGPAAQYMEPWIEKLTTGQTIGSWKEFFHKLTIQYGQRDEKEGAKKELTALFINTDLAHKNFVKYAEKFRTLGRISGYEDNLLIDKLNLVIEKDICLAFIGYKSGNNLPTKWGEKLDLLLEIFKDVHLDKVQGRVFGKDKGPSDAMDVDSVETKSSKGKKGKGKAKERINNNGEKKEKFCHICNQTSHNTIDCDNNAKGPNYKPRSDEKKGDKKKSPEDKKKSGKTHKI